MDTTPSGTQPQFKSVDERLAEAIALEQKLRKERMDAEDAMEPLKKKYEAALTAWHKEYERVKALELMKKEFTQ